ncbi:MAG TPA: hypothetical protein VLA89_01425, partial [Gemmatimonadales bacterium]|nr:hypothetical protein [Gemmatimonadales bacterium]
MDVQGKRWTRRSVLVAGAAAAGGVMVGCGKSADKQPPPAIEDARDLDATAPSAPPTPPSSPTPTGVIHPAGIEERALLPGTPWETPLTVANSGVPGPVMMVLGGVHGNEPGGWTAADGVATWRPAAGCLLVLPRANRQAISLFARTTDALG